MQTHLGLIWDIFGSYDSVTALTGATWARRVLKVYEVGQTWILVCVARCQIWIIEPDEAQILYTHFDMGYGMCCEVQRQ